MTTKQVKDDVDIRRQIDKMVEAIRAGDLEILKRIYAKDIVSFDVQAPLQALGAEALLKNWANAFAMFEMPINYEVRGLVLTLGVDVAFAHFFGRPSGTLKKGSRNEGFWLRVTLGLQKIDDSWLIVHEHVSAPLDFVSGKAVIDLEP